jgi:TRAP-type C4-dicarboxylate transport system permease small subunit
MSLDKFESTYEKFLQIILFVMMIALAVVVLAGVTFRFSGHALAWYDEVASG